MTSPDTFRFMSDEDAKKFLTTATPMTLQLATTPVVVVPPREKGIEQARALPPTVDRAELVGALYRAIERAYDIERRSGYPLPAAGVVGLAIYELITPNATCPVPADHVYPKEG